MRVKSFSLMVSSSNHAIAGASGQKDTALGRRSWLAVWVLALAIIAPHARGADTEGLAALGRAAGIEISFAPQPGEKSDPRFVAIWKADATVIESGNGKMDEAQRPIDPSKPIGPDNVKYDTSLLAADAKFAHDNGYKLALLHPGSAYYITTPGWVRDITSPDIATKVMTDYITAVMTTPGVGGQTYAMVGNNETIDEWTNVDVSPTWIRRVGQDAKTPQPWYPSLGDGYATLPFRIIRSLDKKVIIGLSDDALHLSGFHHKFDRKFDHLVAVVKALQAEGYKPAVFIQWHLDPTQAEAGDPSDLWGPLGNPKVFDRKIYRARLARLAKLGVSVHLTEGDCNDAPLAEPDPQKRDEICANYMKDFLTDSLASGVVKRIGFANTADLHSYIPNYQPADIKHPGPAAAMVYDINLHKTAKWWAVHDVLAAQAAARSH
jgi:GH35 family endo-1,4-beta-xylanase